MAVCCGIIRSNNRTRFHVTSHRIEQTELFSNNAGCPEGFVYRANFISPDEERALVRAIERLAFSEVKMHGVTARRRTVHFGRTYDFQTLKLSPAEEIPGFLDVVRERASGLTDWAGPDIEEALVTEYQPGGLAGIATLRNSALLWAFLCSANAPCSSGHGRTSKGGGK